MSQINSLSSSDTHLATAPLKLVGKKHIVRALLSLATAALLIRILGMLNQVVVSSRFGAGAAMDAYFIASTLPLIIAQVIINTFQGSIIPTYARVYSQGEKERADQLFSTLLNLVLVGMILLVLVMLIFRQQIVFLSAPALDSYRLGLAINLTPLIYPVIFLMAVTSFLESILNARGTFGWPAYTGAILSLVTAAFVLLGGSTYGVIMLCVGMLAGLFLQLCIFIIGARRAGLVYRPVLHLRSPEIILIASVAWPVFLALIINQGSPLVDLMFASFLSTGSISALNYALKITSVFSGVVFASVGRAALPYLSRQATSNMKDFKETLRLYIWLVGIGTTAMSIFMIVLAHPIVRILFQRGAFSAEDTSRTATTLMGFLVGLTPMAFSFIVFTLFSALGKTRMLMAIAIFSVLANALLDYIFVHLWQSQGIALATSAVYFCSMFISLFILSRMIGKLDLHIPPPEILRSIQKIYYQSPFAGNEENFFMLRIPHRMRQQIIRIVTIMTAFTIGIVGVLVNSLYTLRIVFGSLLILILLRYPYIILVSWALINAINPLPVFRGSNILIGLTIPTVFIVCLMPIGQTFRRMPALAFLLLYLLWVFLGIGISAIGVGSFLIYWTQFLDCLLVAILAINLITTRRRMLGIIDATLLVTVLIALYGIYGYITKQNGVEDAGTTLFRIVSIYAAPPSLAMLFSIAIPLAIYRAFISRGVMLAISLIAVLVLLIATGLTFTRAAFISIPLSIIIMALFSPSRKIKITLFSGIIALAVLALLLTTFGNLPILDRFFNQDVTTLNGRSYLWQALLSNFNPTHLLGNGLYASNSLLTSLNVGVNGQGLIGTSPHSLIIGTLYDHGIIGLTLLIALFMALFTNMIVEMRKTTGDRRVLFAAAIAALVSITIQSIDSNDFWDQSISMYIWLTLTLPFATYWFPSAQNALNSRKINVEDKGTNAPRIKAVQPPQQEQAGISNAEDEDMTIPQIKAVQPPQQEQVGISNAEDEDMTIPRIKAVQPPQQEQAGITTIESETREREKC